MCDPVNNMSHEQKLHFFLAGFIATITEMNATEINARLAAGQGPVKDLPVSAPLMPPPPPPLPQANDPSFVCECPKWRKGPCPHPASLMAKTKTKCPKDPSNPDGPKSMFSFSQLCKKEYQKSRKGNNSQVSLKRANPAEDAAAAANSGASPSKKQASTPLSNAANEDGLEVFEEVEEEVEEEGDKGVEV